MLVNASATGNAVAHPRLAVSSIRAANCRIVELAVIVSIPEVQSFIKGVRRIPFQAIVADGIAESLLQTDAIS